MEWLDSVSGGGWACAALLAYTSLLVSHANRVGGEVGELESVDAGAQRRAPDYRVGNECVEEGAYGQSRMIAYLADLLATDDLLRAVAWYATQAYNWGAGHPQLLSEAGQLTSVGRTFASVQR